MFHFYINFLNCILLSVVVICLAVDKDTTEFIFFYYLKLVNCYCNYDGH